MYLVAFLGNIGEKYQKNRHNVGFLFLDFLIEKFNLNENFENKFFSNFIIDSFFNNKVIFVKPQTFMNLSGKSVITVANFFKIKKEHILIIYDDKDQKLGDFKFKKNGSAGGQNGMKNVINVFGSQDINRIKIGVDNIKRKEYKIDTAKFVLSNFDEEELKILKATVFPNIIEKYFDSFFSGQL